MPGFAQARARLNKAVDARLGDPGTWNGAAVRLRIREEDIQGGFGEGGQLILRGLVARIHRDHVAQPIIGDVAAVTGDPRQFRVSGECQQDANGVWVCPVADIAAG